MICVEVHANNVLTVRNDTLANAVSDSVKHETVKFLFSDNWKDYQKTAVFSAEGVNPVNIVLSKENKLCVAEDECYIPFEVLKGDSFSLSVFGTKGESLATTTKEEIIVLTSGYALGDAPANPTQTEYSQLLDMMADAKEIAQSVREDADKGLFKGEKGDKGENYIITDSDKREIAEAIKQDEFMGDIDASLDRIIAIQENLLGGDSE